MRWRLRRSPPGRSPGENPTLARSSSSLNARSRYPLIYRPVLPQPSLTLHESQARP